MPVSTEFNGKIVTVSDDERQKCEIWSRCMGYLRPVADWNAGKQSEFKDRKRFVPTSVQTSDPQTSMEFEVA